MIKKVINPIEEFEVNKEPLFGYHEYQLDLLDAIIDINNDYDYIKIEKSRRIGITWALGHFMAVMASFFGSNVYYKSLGHETNQEFAAGFREKMKEIISCTNGKVCFENKNLFDMKIRTIWNTTCRVATLSSRPGNTRSKGLKNDFFIVDEAAGIQNLKDVLFPIVSGGQALGAKLIVLSTHAGKYNYFNTDIMRVSGKRDAHFKITLEDALNKGMWERLQEDGIKTTKGCKSAKEFKELLYDLSLEKAGDPEEEYGCVPSDTTGAVFPAHILNNALEKTLPYFFFDGTSINQTFSDLYFQNAAKDYITESVFNGKNIQECIMYMDKEYNGRWIFGHDPARSGGKTANTSSLAMIKMHNEKGKTTYHSMFVEMFGTPFPFQEYIVRMIYDLCNRFGGVERVSVEQNGLGATLAESLERTIGAIPVNASMTKKTSNLNKLREYMESGIIFFPDDERIKSDFRHIEYKLNSKNMDASGRQPASKKLGKRHCDSVFSTAWAISETIYKENKTEKEDLINAYKQLRR